MSSLKLMIDHFTVGTPDMFPAHRVIPILAYTVGLHLKGVPFLGLMYMKG